MSLIGRCGKRSCSAAGTEAMAAISKAIEAAKAAGHRRQSVNATIVSSPQILVVGPRPRPLRVDDDAAKQPLFVFRARLAGHVNGII
jgi:hypothetical protein